MKKNNLMNKVLPFAFFLFVTTAFAIPKDPCAPKDVCCEEPAAGPYAFSYNQDLGLSCPRDFYVHGEFLWIKPIEGGLDYAMKDSTSTGDFPWVDGRIKGFSSNSNEWDWRPGFRVGIGSYAMHDYWNFQADWTYVRIKANSDITSSAQDLLSLYLPGVSPAGPFSDATSARWSGDYNTFDLMMGKAYHVSRFYISNPMFGIRAAFIDQDFLVRFFNDFNKNTVQCKNDFWGVGLRGLYEADFEISSNWNIYAKTALSILFGKFDISEHSDNEFVSAFGNLVANYDLENTFYKTIPNSEIGIGISWSDFFFQNQYKVFLKIGYEFHYYWNLYQVRNMKSNVVVGNDVYSRGNFSFNGFTFGLHTEF